MWLAAVWGHAVPTRPWTGCLSLIITFLIRLLSSETSEDGMNWGMSLVRPARLAMKPRLQLEQHTYMPWMCNSQSPSRVIKLVRLFCSRQLQVPLKLSADMVDTLSPALGSNGVIFIFPFGWWMRQSRIFSPFSCARLVHGKNWHLIVHVALRLTP